MIKTRTEPPQTLIKSLSLLARILEDDGGRSLSGLAVEAGMPLSTAHRLAVGFERSGFLLRVGRGQYVAGPVLTRIAAVRRDWGSFASRVARPLLKELYRRTGKTVHLGIFEDNMMTYLVKIGDPRCVMISRQGMQLEAYCSGIGKALLANLPKEEQEAYLAAGPFVGLTPKTITSAAELARELADIRERGYAIDDGEITPGLICIAVPIGSEQGVLAAISLIVTHIGEPCIPTDFLPPLIETARAIEARLFPYQELHLNGLNQVRRKPPSITNSDPVI